MLIETLHKLGQISYSFYCVGCGHSHAFMVKNLEGQHVWKFNGNMEKPTFSPSLLNRIENQEHDIKHVCHLFLRNGIIEYLDDCTHAYAGKKVSLKDLKEVS